MECSELPKLKKKDTSIEKECIIVTGGATEELKLCDWRIWGRFCQYRRVDT